MNNLEIFLNKYLEIMKLRGFTQQTLNNCEIHVKFFYRFLNERDISDLTETIEKDLEDYQSYLYYYRKKDGKPLCTETQIAKLVVVRSLFSTLLTARLIFFNPAKNIEMPRERIRLPNEILTQLLLKQFLEVIDVSTVYGFRDRTIVELFYSSGIRTTELCNLTLDDLDFTEGFLKVLRGKGVKDRVVPFGSYASRYLKEYIEKVRPCLVKRNSGDLLFLSKRGRKLDRYAIHKKFTVYSNKAKLIKRVTPRVLRCTMATDMLRFDADMRQIQEILGHTNLKTTQVYTKVLKKELKKAHQKYHPREQILYEETVS